MDVTKHLIQEIDTDILDKLAAYLGESTQLVGLALETASDNFVHRLIEISKSGAGAESILKVIEDGGHSGNLIGNFREIVKKSDQLTLLESIGGNINTHFFDAEPDQTKNLLIEKHALNAETAELVQNLVSPLVLAIIGKEQHLNRYSPGQFARFLESQKKEKDFMAELTDGIDERPIPPVKRFSKRKVARKGSDGITWAMLAMVLAGAVYFGFRARMVSSKGSGQAVDVASVVEDGLPAKKTVNSSVLPKEETVPLDETIKNAKGPSGTKAKAAALAPDYVPSEREEPVSGNNPNQTQDNRPMTEKLALNDAFFGVNTLGYEQGSAEISQVGEIATLATYLKENPGSRVELVGIGSNSQLADDRAYALRYELFALGVPLSRMEIAPSRAQGDSPVEVRIKKSSL